MQYFARIILIFLFDYSPDFCRIGGHDIPDSRGSMRRAGEGFKYGKTRNEREAIGADRKILFEKKKYPPSSNKNRYLFFFKFFQIKL